MHASICSIHQTQTLFNVPLSKLLDELDARLVWPAFLPSQVFRKKYLNISSKKKYLEYPWVPT